MTHAHAAQSLNRVAFSATVHCLTGCAIGEVLGMIIGTALGWGDWETIALAVVLAFFFGYSFTLVPLLRSGMALRRGGSGRPRLRHGLDHDHGDRRQRDHAADPGAMEAGLDNVRFWGSLAFALLVAGAAAYPVNRWLIARGRGHAVVHALHGH